GGKIIGGFIRFHPERNKSENLNMPGMKFQKLFLNENTRPIISGTNEISYYTILVDLATLAICYEYGDISPC
ncbi:MAG TPA: glutamate--cysteine ligase, partial [Candidatus Deferrimicrobium sp.]|nr:glutamate--cysteine ligase [Candidatus Deferrimicrobium sp.]